MPLTAASDLAAVSHDALIAEVQRRLDQGVFGWHGLLSTDQQDHRDNWHAFLDVIYDARNRYPEQFGVQLILEKARELVDRRGPQVGIYAINTTLPGVADPGAHQAMLTRPEAA